MGKSLNGKELGRGITQRRFATRAIENGVQPKTLQKLLGHATLQMTMDLYCHVTEDTLFEEMPKMERMCV